MNPKTERVLGFQGSGFGKIMNAVRVAGQLETIEVCKVWPGGARTRIDRHDLVRKHVVRSPRHLEHNWNNKIQTLISSR